MRKIRVLFLAANPSTTSRSQLEAEVALLLKELPLSEYQGRVDFVSAWASSIDDLREEFAFYYPHVVHFIGKNADKGITLVDSSGHLKPIEATDLYLVFASLYERTRLVILQTCYMADQITPKHGDSLAELVGCVIGINHSIDARSATIFVINLYRGIMRGFSTLEAFNQGHSAISFAAQPEERSLEFLEKNFYVPGEDVLLPILETPIATRLKKQPQGEEPAMTSTPQGEEPAASVPSVAPVTFSSAESIDLVVVYAQEDQELQKQFMAHLNLLKNQELIHECYESNISRAEGQALLLEHLNTAKVFLLLISVDFMNVSFIKSDTINKAILRHEQGEAYVISILLRSVYWEGSPFAQLPRFPDTNQSIIASRDRDAAFVEIVQSIRLVLQEQRPTIDPQELPATHHDDEHYHLKDVFVTSSIPKVTFVKGKRFDDLKNAFNQKGRCVVIEGPSGIGKTTAIKKAIEDIQSAPLTSDAERIRVTLLSAREPEQREKLETIERWHTSGTVVIDDFQHLTLSESEKIVDHLKLLADTESETKKLVIVGIPQTGQKLVDLSFDVANRISVLKWDKEEYELILQMMEKGEKALKILIKHKMEIAIMARGSLNVAQFLCLYLCQQEQVNETLPRISILDGNIGQAISKVIAHLATKFETVITLFAVLGGKRDSTCLNLLEELAASPNSSLSLLELKAQRPELSSGIERFINEKWIDILYEKHPYSKNCFFFDPSRCILMIEDPQLTFYLRQVMPYPKVARDARIEVAIRQRNIFISSCTRDNKQLTRLQIHLQPLANISTIDPWDEKRLEESVEPERDLQTAITIAKVAVVLVSADFLASNFMKYELHRLLAQAQTSGTRIKPVIVGHCSFNSSQLSIFSAFNSPDRPVRQVRDPDRLWKELAESIKDDFMKDEPQN